MIRSFSRTSGGRGKADLLPTTLTDRGHNYRRTNSSQPWWRRFYTKRILRLVVFAALCFGAVHLFWSADPVVEKTEEKHDTPPLYEKWRQAELRLPQHNPELPYPEGKHGKYIWYANHVHGACYASYIPWEVS